MLKSRFHSRWLCKTQPVYSKYSPPHVCPCETDVSGKQVPVLKAAIAIMKTDFQEFSFRMHVVENGVTLWSSVDRLLWTLNGRAQFVSVSLRAKALEPFPRLWAAGFDASQHSSLGRTQVLVKAATLVPDPDPQSSCQPRELVGPKTTCSS